METLHTIESRPLPTQQGHYTEDTTKQGGLGERLIAFGSTDQPTSRMDSYTGETRRQNRRDCSTPDPRSAQGNGRSDRRAAGLTDGAICVQRLDDSLNSAIHTRYRSSRRSSSMHEPRGPPLKVVSLLLSVPSHEGKTQCSTRSTVSTLPPVHTRQPHRGGIASPGRPYGESNGRGAERTAADGGGLWL